MAFSHAAVRGRLLIGIAVLLLHGLAAIWLFSAPPQRTREVGGAPAMTWIVIAARPPATTPVRAPLPGSLERAATSAPPAPLAEPATPPAAPSTTNIAPPDWQGHLEASAKVAAESALREPRTMGEIPASPNHSLQSSPSFPWSREPISKYFDFDRTSGVSTLSLGRCSLVFVLIIPVFGCPIGRVDPEPGRSDLFDQQYTPPPIEIPDNPLDEASDALDGH